MNTTPFKGRHFLKLADFSTQEIDRLIDLAISLKQAKKEGREQKRLQGKNIALIFEKTSTRTRCAFEVAAYDQGAQITYLESNSAQIGKKESIEDTARVLSRMYDAIEYRGASHALVETLAAFSSVPVFNGLTDEWHPTQMLADLMTIREYSDKSYHDICYVYIGDARNNTANSLLHLGALMGMKTHICAPKSLFPDQKLVSECKALAKSSGAEILLSEDPAEALKGADFVYTDVWVSMGEDPAIWEERIPMLRAYRVSEALLALSQNREILFMHCLPAYHDRHTKIGEEIYQRFHLNGVEVSHKVFEGPRSIVFDQAENRMHTIKALLVAFLS